ncbi:MAG: iron-sulfur cluster assembly scaffold protein [Fimbriimonadales bacterium]
MRSDEIVKMVEHPSRFGELENASHVGRAGMKGEGPYVTFWLRVEDGVVVKATSESHGCSYAIATSSLLAGHIEGMRLCEVLEINARAVESIVGGLPEGKGYCADLASNALCSALPIHDLE